MNHLIIQHGALACGEHRKQGVFATSDPTCVECKECMAAPEYLNMLQRRGREIDGQIAALEAKSEEVVNRIRDIRARQRISSALAAYASQREAAGGKIHPADL